LQTAKLLSGGTATFQSSYAQMVSQVGNKAREVEVTLTAQENLVKQGKDLIQSQSGVNLDEEAANLQRYQQAYQAAGKVMAIAASLFQTVLGIFGN
jgi:flagellar hook-associated protein 1 FlgK